MTKQNTETVKGFSFLHLQKLGNILSVVTQVWHSLQLGQQWLFVKAFSLMIEFILKPIFPTEHGMLSFCLWFICCIRIGIFLSCSLFLILLMMKPQGKIGIKFLKGIRYLWKESYGKLRCEAAEYDFYISSTCGPDKYHYSSNLILHSWCTSWQFSSLNLKKIQWKTKSF